MEMGLMMAFSKVLLLMLMLQVSSSNAQLFDVTKYGAIADGRTDNTKAFEKAWDDACNSSGKQSTFLVPVGTFLVGTITFKGNCKASPITFSLKGTMTAPSDSSVMTDHGTWINFQYINGFVLNGGGSFDGQGASSWNSSSKPRQISLNFAFVKDGSIDHITSLNSKNAHFSIFACENLHLNNIQISAPGNSPNTDGIKIGSSNRINITHSSIRTGDDCVALLSGSSNIEVLDVFCGPGHGISVGSQGGNPNEKNVQVVNVKNCTLKDTTNGLRIKTIASSYASSFSGFTYEDIIMDNVQNPILIDQKYCPSRRCDFKTPSHVQIQDITFNNVRGTSATKVAVKLDCSQGFPCKNVVLKDINLVQQGGAAATSECSYANGASYGRQTPPSCIVKQ